MTITHGTVYRVPVIPPPSDSTSTMLTTAGLVEVGKPIPNRRIRKKTSIDSPLEQKLLCEPDLEDILKILRELDFADRDYPAVMKAQDDSSVLRWEESWKKSGIDPVNRLQQSR